MPYTIGGGSQHSDDTISALGGSVALSVSGVGTAAVQITGDWSGALYFQGTVLSNPVSDSDWFPICACPPTPGESIIFTRTNGAWLIATPGYKQIRVVAIEFYGGSATISLSAAQGSQTIALFAPVNLAGTMLLNGIRTLPVLDTDTKKLLEKLLIAITELSDCITQ